MPLALSRAPCMWRTAGLDSLTAVGPQVPHPLHQPQLDRDQRGRAGRPRRHRRRRVRAPPRHARAVGSGRLPAAAVLRDRHDPLVEQAELPDRQQARRAHRLLARQSLGPRGSRVGSKRTPLIPPRSGEGGIIAKRWWVGLLSPFGGAKAPTGGPPSPTLTRRCFPLYPRRRGPRCLTTTATKRKCAAQPSRALPFRRKPHAPNARSLRPASGAPTSMPLEKNSKRRKPMSLRIGDVAPDFEANTTKARSSFTNGWGDSWGILFSHPKDFTPVCHDRARRHGQAQPRLQEAQRQGHRPQRRSGRQARRLGEGHRGDAGHRARLPDDRRSRAEDFEALRHAPRRRRRNLGRPHRRRQPDRPHGLRHRPRQEDQAVALPTR